MFGRERPGSPADAHIEFRLKLPPKPAVRGVGTQGLESEPPLAGKAEGCRADPPLAAMLFACEPEEETGLTAGSARAVKYNS